MNYSNKIEKKNQKFKCQLCNDPVQNPIILPCGNVICFKELEQCCINNLIKNCQFCHKDHVKPTDGFVAMKTLDELMGLDEDEIYKLLFKLLHL
jgi:hypothetical protein